MFEKILIAIAAVLAGVACALFLGSTAGCGGTGATDSSYDAGADTDTDTDVDTDQDSQAMWRCLICNE